MKKAVVVLLIVFGLTRCDLWELYEVKFIDIQHDEIVSYKLNLKDSLITDYGMYINDILTETTTINWDTNKFEQITLGKEGQLLKKRLFYFNFNGLAEKTLDSIYSGDSIIVTETDYHYNKKFLSRETSISYDSVHNLTNIKVEKRYIYGDGNVVKIEVLKEGGKCNDVLSYTDYSNKIDIDNFWNGLMGNRNENLVAKIEWRASCYNDEDIAVPASLFQYKFNMDSLVIEKKEIYTPEYNKLLESEVDRWIYITQYEYNFTP